MKHLIAAAVLALVSAPVQASTFTLPAHHTIYDDIYLTGTPGDVTLSVFYPEERPVVPCCFLSAWGVYLLQPAQTRTSFNQVQSFSDRLDYRETYSPTVSSSGTPVTYSITELAEIFWLNLLVDTEGSARGLVTLTLLFQDPSGALIPPPSATIIPVIPNPIPPSILLFATILSLLALRRLTPLRT